MEKKQRFITLLLLFVAVSHVSWALEVPRLQGRINDYANIVSPATEAELESYLAAVEKQSGAQIALLTIESLEGRSLESFSIAVVDQWKLGDAEKDNGVLLLIAMAEKDIRIEVGYGLEGILTDAASGYIIRENISPNFRQGNFDAGVKAGLTTIGQLVAGEITITPQQAAESEEKGESSIITLFIILFIVVNILSRMGRIGRYRRRGMSPLSAFFLGSMLGGSSRGRSSSGFGGGGFSGGGFSGGGGGFGGGGASGGW